MDKVIEFPKDQSMHEFIKEHFTQMEGVKGIVAGLLMEDGKIDLIVNGMDWKKVVWIAAHITDFAVQCGDE